MLAGSLLGLTIYAAQRPFSVKDSIEMVRIADPDVALSSLQAIHFNTSADGKNIALTLHQGNLQTGSTEFWIVVMDEEEIVKAIATSDVRLPDWPKRCALQTSSNSPAIEYVQWLTGDRLAFIGREDTHGAQVYVCDLKTHTAERLTNSPSDITSFALSGDGKMLVYAAQSHPDWSQRNTHGYAVRSEYAGTFFWTDPKDYPADVRYFAFDLAAQKTVPINTAPARYAPQIQLSSSGRTVTFTAFNIEGIPEGWRRYKDIQMRARLKSPAVPESNDALGSRSNWFGQLVIADTSTGHVSLPLDSPAMPQSGLKTLWSAGDRSLLLVNAYMPLGGIADPKEINRREENRVVAEMFVDSGKVIRIVDVPAGSAATAEWISEDRVAVQFTGSLSQSPRQTLFQRRKGVWSAIGTPSVAARAQPRILYSIRQGMNTPIDLLARDTKTGRERVVTQLNPQLKDLDLGVVERFDWSDKNGRTYNGGILLPRQLNSTRKYPLVIQTYGFDPNAFLVDGPFSITSAYVARPLASVGIAVLQLPLQSSATGPRQAGTCIDWATCGENPVFLQMLESAIDTVVSRQPIDGSRIGLMGFSREGMHVFNAITFGRHSIAAATVADSIGSSPFAYTLLYGFPYPGMLEFEDAKVMGAPFWGRGVEMWRERSPIFHLDRIRAPVRFETYGTGMPGYFDAFALLKRHGRPADYIHIPNASHLLQAPYARYTSQQGNVDWFRFWLLNEEDPTVEKSQQYIRWRKLRLQRDVLVD